MNKQNHSSEKRKRRRKKNERKAIILAVLVVVSVIALAVTLAAVVFKADFFTGKNRDEQKDLQENNAKSEIEVTVEDSTDQIEHGDGQDGAGLGQENETDPDALDQSTAQNDENVQVLRDVTMVFAGDICFYDAYANMTALRARGGKIENCIDEKLLDEMKAADICMVNNEFAYSDRGTPLADKAFTFCSKPSNVSLLHDMGVDLVSLANNHVYDYGPDALLDTLDTLKAADIPYVGAGRDLDEASAVYYFEKNGRKIAFISATQVERNEHPDTKGATDATPGTFRCFTKDEFAKLTEVIREADAQADLTVVYVHWGTENTDELHWAQIEQAPKMVEAGADLIIGDHPHCLQNVEYVNGVPVIYSLGNFWFNSKTLDTCLFKVVYRTDGTLSCQLIPAKQHDCRTDMETGSEKQRILDYMQCISPNVTFDQDGNITNTPYTGPKIDYDAVERVPDPPTTAVTLPATDPSNPVPGDAAPVTVQ
ncbi:MAG: CapA family protein [Lachnospiraceae bacterium]|nr:CapA family protein [Lachnospiraceae bacterium]